MVRHSIAGVAFARDFLEVNFSRTYLLLEPDLFHLQMLHFPTSTARQDAFDRRRITVDLDLHVISELPAELRNTKNLATHFQRCIQSSLSARQSDTRLSSRVVKQQVRSMYNNSSAGGSPGELPASPVTVGVPGQFSWMILPLVEICRCRSLSQLFQYSPQFHFFSLSWCAQRPGSSF